MFLLSALRAHGIVDRGQPFQGTYVGARRGDELVGVVVHYRRGNLALNAPTHASELSTRATELSGRPVAGAVGPEAQVDAVESALGLGPPGRGVQMDERETLYRLDLAGLVEPAALREGTVRGRAFAAEDLETMVAWTVRYRVESAGDPDDAALRRRVEDTLASEVGDGHWLLEKDGELVAKTAFNARLPDAVQIGGVWTPHANRGRGYARCVLASHLQWVRRQGVATAILFTGDGNLPARRAYDALGFRPVGRYRVLILRAPSS